jgi:hypothetical protein
VAKLVGECPTPPNSRGGSSCQDDPGEAPKARGQTLRNRRCVPSEHQPMDAVRRRLRVRVLQGVVWRRDIVPSASVFVTRPSGAEWVADLTELFAYLHILSTAKGVIALATIYAAACATPDSVGDVSFCFEIGGLFRNNDLFRNNFPVSTPVTSFETTFLFRNKCLISTKVTISKQVETNHSTIVRLSNVEFESKRIGLQDRRPPSGRLH